MGERLSPQPLLHSLRPPQSVIQSQPPPIQRQLPTPASLFCQPELHSVFTATQAPSQDLHKRHASRNNIVAMKGNKVSDVQLRMHACAKHSSYPNNLSNHLALLLLLLLLRTENAIRSPGQPDVVVRASFIDSLHYHFSLFEKKR